MKQNEKHRFKQKTQEFTIDWFQWKRECQSPLQDKIQKLQYSIKENVESKVPKNRKCNIKNQI